MDHDVLLDMIARRIGDKQVLRLIARIIRRPFPGQQSPRFFPGDDLFDNAARTCGLPIGNQTSQLFANVYLDPVDHLIKEDLRVPGYVRYMDDLLLFAESKRQLWETLAAVRERLLDIRLRLHVRKTSISPTQCGFRFLGFRIFPNRFEVPQSKLHRFRRRLASLQDLHERKQLDFVTARQSLYSYWGHFMQAGSSTLIRDVVTNYSFVNWVRTLETERIGQNCKRHNQEQ